MSFLPENIFDETINVIHFFMFHLLDMHPLNMVSDKMSSTQDALLGTPKHGGGLEEYHFCHCWSCKLKSSILSKEHHFYLAMTNKLWLFRLLCLIGRQFFKKEQSESLSSRGKKPGSICCQ